MFFDGPRLTVTRRRPTLERDARIGFTVSGQVQADGPGHHRPHEAVPEPRVPRPGPRRAPTAAVGRRLEHDPRGESVPGPRSHRLLREDRTRYVRRSVALVRPPARARLRVRDPDPRQHRRDPGRDAGLRPGPRHADARAVRLLRDPAPGHVRRPARHGRRRALRGGRLRAAHRRPRRAVRAVHRVSSSAMACATSSNRARTRPPSTGGSPRIDFPPAVRVRRNVLLHRIRGRSGRTRSDASRGRSHRAAGCDANPRA